MKFTNRMWSFIWLLYRFRYTNKWYKFQLRYERNSTIPQIFTEFSSIRLHNGKKLSFVFINKYKIGTRLGYYLITQYPTKLKKKKKKNKK